MECTMYQSQRQSLIIEARGQSASHTLTPLTTRLELAGRPLMESYHHTIPLQQLSTDQPDGNPSGRFVMPAYRKEAIQVTSV